MAVSAPSIPSGEHVQLSLPHVGLLPATVSGCESGAIALVLAVKDSRVSRLAGSAPTYGSLTETLRPTGSVTGGDTAMVLYGSSRCARSAASAGSTASRPQM